MPEIQWEYCRLWVANAKEHKKGGFLGIGAETQGYGYDCGIVYYSISGKVISQQLTQNNEATNTQPFSTAMGMLGARGWELVNVQHGNAVIAESGSATSFHAWWDTISWANVVAYFKRPSLPSRAVDEPKLSLR